MTTHPETLIELPTWAAWDEFVDLNRDEIEARYGSAEGALMGAAGSGLAMGGGAQPDFIVTLAFALPQGSEPAIRSGFDL